jgi:TPR repeat protein
MKTIAQQPQPQPPLAEIRAIAERGHAEAQFELALVYAGGEVVPRDYVVAAKWLRKAADQGDAEAQTGLGTLYAYGDGVPKDETLAYQWLLLAGAQGSAFAKRASTRLEENLTPEMRAEGQRLAREFKPKIAVAA